MATQQPDTHGETTKEQPFDVKDKAAIVTGAGSGTLQSLIIVELATYHLEFWIKTDKSKA